MWRHSGSSITGVNVLIYLHPWSLLQASTWGVNAPVSPVVASVAHPVRPQQPAGGVLQGGEHDGPQKPLPEGLQWGGWGRLQRRGLHAGRCLWQSLLCPGSGKFNGEIMKSGDCNVAGWMIEMRKDDSRWLSGYRVGCVMVKNTVHWQYMTRHPLHLGLIIFCWHEASVIDWFYISES